MPLTAFQRFKLNLLVRWFGFKDVPLIGTAGVRVVDLDAERCVVKVPLKRRTKNHLNSLYFGAFAIGADTAGALLAIVESRRHGNAVSLVFKDFKGEFLKRAEADTLFTCTDGQAVRAAFTAALRTGERVNVPVRIVATTPEKFGDEPVAVFTLTLSLRKRPSA